MYGPFRHLPLVVAAALWLPGQPRTDGIESPIKEAAAPTHEALVHNIHVTYATLGVDQNYASARVKYFKHDLEKAIAQAVKQDTVVLGVDAGSDSLYMGYVDTMFVLLQNGEPLEGRLTSSGEEGEMWWYEILYQAPRTIDQLTIVNRQLTEIFYDQKNILKAENLETGKRRAFYYNGKVTRYDVSL